MVGRAPSGGWSGRHILTVNVTAFPEPVQSGAAMLNANNSCLAWIAEMSGRATPVPRLFRVACIPEECRYGVLASSAGIWSGGTGRL